MNEDEQRYLESIPRLPNGRFPCQFEGCDKSFKYVPPTYNFNFIHEQCQVSESNTNHITVVLNISACGLKIF